MASIEGLRLRIRKILISIYAKMNKDVICDENFTIISNNCWGGQVYESYGLIKQTPTVGLFFFPSDYIKLLKRMREYFSAELNFIDPYSSKWIAEDALNEVRFGKYPVGKITLADGESIEIFFLHYHSQDQAKEKWNRRCERINYNRMIVKFNDQNGATEKDVEDFIELSIKNKIFFTSRKWKSEKDYRSKLDDYYYIFQLLDYGYVTASHEPVCWNRYIKLDQMINNLGGQ